MEKRRLSVECDTIELNFLKTIKRLNLDVDNMRTSSLVVRMAMLEVTIKLDLSGEEWDDDYNPKNG